MTSGERAVAGGPGGEVLGASVRSGGADAGRGRTVQGGCRAPVLRLKFTNVIDRPRPMDLIF